MNDIPAPYDQNNSRRTITEAMKELQAFRASRQAHDLSVLRRRYYDTRGYEDTDTHEDERTEEVVEPKKPKRKAK